MGTMKGRADSRTLSSVSHGDLLPWAESRLQLQPSVLQQTKLEMGTSYFIVWSIRGDKIFPIMIILQLKMITHLAPDVPLSLLTKATIWVTVSELLQLLFGMPPWWNIIPLPPTRTAQEKLAVLPTSQYLAVSVAQESKLEEEEGHPVSLEPECLVHVKHLRHSTLGKSRVNKCNFFPIIKNRNKNGPESHFDYFLFSKQSVKAPTNHTPVHCSNTHALVDINIKKDTAVLTMFKSQLLGSFPESLTNN